ncbi:SusC/RagA family TonB-linked outer membrane protein [Desertivirga arenae]|uniref:SusC/RagA family TonB-linked outer membrane protein n=1 Tax=Desertivirga arenae TaxID=2810309 RepID=UPI001A964AD9|nr:TonB-dependent receptor [Pedobacter sp. SYSU D00823]
MNLITRSWRITRTSLLCLGLFAYAGNVETAQAQTQTTPLINSNLTGKVIDAKTKETLPGAIVHIKGTTHEVNTDANGAFKFVTGQKFPYTLEVSFIGYEKTEVVVNGPTVTVALKESVNQLNEIVVVGYGTQKRIDLTGSVASVSQKVLSQPVSSLERLLQGSIAGAQVTQVSGQPGAPVSIRIRGGSSVTAGNEPLYVIDGFPIESNNGYASSGTAAGPNVNALATLSPGDIETIDVLKDASATAIYGSRGANGVVLITTKRGKAGRNIVNYDVSYGKQDVTKKVDVITNSRQWAELKNEARINAGKTAYYTTEQLNALGEGTDWQAEAFTNAPSQNHNLSISGGDDKTHYAVTGNYYKQDGILFNTNFKRYSARVNFDRNVSTKFKVSASFSASKTNSNIAKDNIVRALLLMPPTVSVRDASGAYTYQSEFETPLGNPIATLAGETNQSNNNRVLGNIFGEYKIVDGLTAKVSVGGDILNNKENRYIPSTIYQGANTITTGEASVGTRTITNWLNENTLNYVKSFGNKHSINALVGYTEQSMHLEGVTAGSYGFSAEQTTFNDLGSGATYSKPTSISRDWVLKSALARLNYSFEEKYLFTVTGRADGSSKFGANNKWGYFPSAAFAWNVSKETAFDLPSAISNLKLRLSAGLTGNQDIDPYQSLATLGNNNYIFNGTTVIGYAPNRIINPDLSWESTAQYDAGIDLSLFKNRINLVLDGYYKRTEDLLLNVPLIYTTGQSTSLQNYGTVSNKGLELSINTNNLQGDFTWSSSLNLSTNKNKILSLGEGVEYIINGVSIAQVGQPLGTFYGLKTNGIFQSTDDISKLPVYLTRNKPGDQRYVDRNGDNTITETSDRFFIGNAQPKLLGGFTNNFSYKGLDLTVLFQGSYGNKIFNQNRQQLEILSGQQNASTTALQRWTPENGGNLIPRAYEDPAVVNSDRYVEDGSYLRLKNLTVGYTLPIRFASKNNNAKMRLYFTAQNLATWTKYSGFDPEVSKNGQSTIGAGVDQYVYPTAKLFLGGINITL